MCRHTTFLRFGHKLKIEGPTNTFVGSVPQGYVMQRYDTDLHSWASEHPDEMRACLGDLTETLKSALECMHGAGWGWLNHFLL